MGNIFETMKILFENQKKCKTKNKNTQLKAEIKHLQSNNNQHLSSVFNLLLFLLIMGCGINENFYFFVYIL